MIHMGNTMMNMLLNQLSDIQVTADDDIAMIQVYYN